MFSDFYHFLLRFRFMWVRRKIDSQHVMRFPRFGYSKKMIKEAEQRAKELMESLEWD
jgi:hypothetical protein